MTNGEGSLTPMSERHPSLCQVVRRQLNRHPVACQDPDVVLAHFAGQMGQYLVPLGNLNLECSITHTFDYSSINRDHVFFWNDVTSFPRVHSDECLDFESHRLVGCNKVFASEAVKTPQSSSYRDARLALKERADDERNRPISVVNFTCSSDLPSVNPVSLDRSNLIPAIRSMDASVDSSSGLTSVNAAPSRPALAVRPTRWM